MASVWIRNAQLCVCLERSHQKISHFLEFGGLVKPMFRVFWAENWFLDAFRGPVGSDIQKYRFFSRIIGMDMRIYRIFSSLWGLTLQFPLLLGDFFGAILETFFAPKTHSKISIDFKTIFDQFLE